MTGGSCVGTWLVECRSLSGTLVKPYMQAALMSMMNLESQKGGPS